MMNRNIPEFAKNEIEPRTRFKRRSLLSLAIIAVACPGLSFAEEALPKGNAEQIIRDLLEAMAVNDATRIRSAFAEHASQAYGNGPARSGDAFRAWLESDIIEPHGRVEDAVLEIDGDRVVVTGQYRNSRNYSSAADFLMLVADGKIVSWQMRY